MLFCGSEILLCGRGFCITGRVWSKEFTRELLLDKRLRAFNNRLGDV